MKKFTSFEILVPVILGIIVFAYYFDFTILEPSNTAWMIGNGGDGAQHYLGSYAFRTDSWHFPITKTELINYPEGVAIIYTDANPLLSIITKIFRGIFPPEYQFYGIWLFACWILQSILGYLIVKKLTNNFLYSCLAGLLFCLLPTQVFRLFHVNLVGLWLILWGIYIFINNDLSIRRKQFLFFLLFIISSMVHAYFVLMSIFIGMTWYFVIANDMFTLKQRKELVRFIITNCLYGASFILFLWMLGYFYNNPKAPQGLDGYGYYSMNLNSPFDPHEARFSNFITPGVINGGQYEGFQYFGLGIIMLLIFVSILNFTANSSTLKSPLGLFFICILLIPFIIKQGESSISDFDRLAIFFLLFFYISTLYVLYKQKEKWLLLLMIPATLCFIHALSNTITWGTTTLFDLKLGDRDFYSGFFRTSRSSGRFFWVTSQILLLLGIFFIYKNIKSAKYSIVILASFVVIQFLDLSKLSYLIDSNKKDRTLNIDEDSKKMILASKHISFLSDFNIEIGEFALLNKKTINKFYTAHGTGKITEAKLAKEDSSFKSGLLNPDYLYLFNLNTLPWNRTMEVYPSFWNNFLAIAPKNYKPDSVGTILIKKVQTDSLETLFKLIQSKELTIISIKDEASTKLPKAFTEKFDQLFGSNLRNLGFRNRYFAVFNNGKLVKEEFNVDKDIEYSGIINSMPFFVKSAETQSNIHLNTVNYSLNERGINFVSAEKTSSGKLLISTGSFDTYEHSYEYK